MSILDMNQSQNTFNIISPSELLLKKPNAGPKDNPPLGVIKLETQKISVKPRTRNACQINDENTKITSQTNKPSTVDDDKKIISFAEPNLFEPRYTIDEESYCVDMTPTPMNINQTEKVTQEDEGNLSIYSCEKVKALKEKTNQSCNISLTSSHYAENPHAIASDRKVYGVGLGPLSNLKQNNSVDARTNENDETPKFPDPQGFFIRTSNVITNIEPESTIRLNVGQASEAQQSQDQQHLADLNSGLYLRQACALLTTIIFVSFQIILIIANEIQSYRNIFLIVYCYQGYTALEKIIRLFSPEIERWRKRERVFDLFDTVAATLFVACLDLYFSSHDFFMITVSIPFLVIAATYTLGSNAPHSIKDLKMVIRSLYAFGTLIVSIKLNGYLDWDWRATLVFLWVYLGACFIYSLIIITLLILIIVTAIFKPQAHSATFVRNRIIGLFWYSLYYGLSAFSILGLIGATEQDETRSYEFVRTSAVLALSLGSFILIYTILLFRPLKKFLQTFETIRYGSMSNDLMSSMVEAKRHVVEFQVEKIKTYFQRISPTYFVPFQKAFLHKRRSEIKTAWRKVWPIVTIVNELDEKEMEGNQGKILANNKCQVIENLKREKHILDSKLKVISCANIKKERNFKRNSLPKLNIQRDSVGNSKNELDRKTSSYAKNCKKYFTVDGLEALPETKRSVQSCEKDNLCYICVEKIPDAVLMDCGHGGICHDCAFSMIRKKNECMECRKPVKAIYKIDPTPWLGNCFRGVEVAQIIELNEMI